MIAQRCGGPDGCQEQFRNANDYARHRHQGEVLRKRARKHRLAEVDPQVEAALERALTQRNGRLLRAAALSRRLLQRQPDALVVVPYAPR